MAGAFNVLNKELNSTIDKNITLEVIKKSSSLFKQMMVDFEKDQDEIQLKNCPGLIFYDTPEKRAQSYFSAFKTNSDFYYIKLEGNIIVGYTSFSKNPFYKNVHTIKELYIMENYQSKGYGRIVIEEIKKLAKLNKSQFVSVGFMIGNDRAEYLYKSCNFTILSSSSLFCKL